MHDDTMTGGEWLTRHGVTFDWSATGFHLDADGWEHQRFTLTLTSDDGRTLDIPWRQGLGVESVPDPDGTLWAVASDVRSGELDWSEFADEFGYDEYEAPLSHYRTWEACRDMGRAVREFCTSADMLRDFLTIEDES